MLLEKPERKRGFKMERILRILLNHPDGDMTKYRIAKLAEVSEPWCREYTERLEKQGLVKNTEVLKPRKIYEKWQETRIEPNQITVSLQRPEKLLRETDLHYGLTTYKAENLIQNFLFASTTDFYIHPDDIQEWQNVVEEKGLIGGGNTRIRVTDSHVFYNTQKRKRFNIVSTPQLIIDLLDEGGPCEEAARKLINSYHGNK